MEAEILGLVAAGVGVALGGVATLAVQRLRRRSVKETNHNGMPFVGALPGIHKHDWYTYREQIHPETKWARRCRVESCEQQQHWTPAGWRKDAE